MRVSLSLLAGLALAGATTAALGQGAVEQTPAPASPMEVSHVGDWGVRCISTPSPSPCDMFQLVNQRQTGKRVMSLSIAYMPQGDHHLIQIALPLGVWFEKGVKISAGAYNSPLLQYRRCDRDGCYVEGYIDNAVMAALAQGAGNAKISIVSDDDHPYDIAFSLKGFSDAHDAMVTLARQKVSPAPAPAPVAAEPAAPPSQNKPFTPRRRR